MSGKEGKLKKEEYMKKFVELLEAYPRAIMVTVDNVSVLSVFAASGEVLMLVTYRWLLTFVDSKVFLNLFLDLP